MLVYLDSAHFALLERASEAGSKEFWTAWHSCGCELALSLHHLQEIGQLSDRGSAERRLRILEPFPVIRSRQEGFNLVISLEIQFQFLKLAGYEILVKRSALETLFPITQLSELTKSVEVQPIFHLMRAALATGTEGANLAKEAARIGPAVDFDAPVDVAQMMSAESEAAVEAELANLPPATANLMRQMVDQVRATIIREGTVGEALKAIYGLQEIAKHRTIPESDLAAVSLFYKEASAEATRLGIDRNKVQTLLSQLDPYQAPGFALQLAVHRARTLHPKPDEPGDQIDVAHIAFAPYVDLAFVDKRTLGFLTQEARDRPQFLSPEFTKNIKKAGTLDRVAEVVREHHHALESASKASSV